MNIADVIAVAGRAGFFNRDLAAIEAGAKADGFAYPGKPVSPVSAASCSRDGGYAAALADRRTMAEIVARSPLAASLWFTLTDPGSRGILWAQSKALTRGGNVPCGRAVDLIEA